MDLANYKMEWPRERLTVRCFAHDIMNYRYHWHPDEYELNILLHGSQGVLPWNAECCTGGG